MGRLLKTARIAAGSAVVIALLLLAWQCLDIWLTGNSAANLDEKGLYIRPVYSREDAASRLEGLALPLALCAGAAAVSALLHAAGPIPPEKQPGLTPENRLRLLKARISPLPQEAQQEEQLRRNLGIGFGAVMGLLGICCLAYLLRPDSFPLWSSVTMDQVMGRLLLHTAPPSLLALLLGIALSFLRKASILREIALLQPLPKTGPAPAGEAPKKPTYLRAVLYALACAFILLGVMNGGLRDVLYKAINICTECIGLG